MQCDVLTATQALRFYFLFTQGLLHKRADRNNNPPWVLGNKRTLTNVFQTCLVINIQVCPAPPGVS